MAACAFFRLPEGEYTSVKSVRGVERVTQNGRTTEQSHSCEVPGKGLPLDGEDQAGRTKQEKEVASPRAPLLPTSARTPARRQAFRRPTARSAGGS